MVMLRARLYVVEGTVGRGGVGGTELPMQQMMMQTVKRQQLNHG